MILVIGLVWLVMAMVVGVVDVKKGRPLSVAYGAALVNSNVWFAAAMIN